MKTIQSMLVPAALAIAMSAPASAGVNDPEIIIYRFPGVIDSGGATNQGWATSFNCTNFSGATETVRFVTRASAGSLLSNVALIISHLSTLTVSTHETLLYIDSGSGNLATGIVAGGTTAVAATSNNIICNAVAVDAAASGPSGFALRGIRFNPPPGSQE